jgi:DNA-binding response OmpR family regulator
MQATPPPADVPVSTSIKPSILYLEGDIILRQATAEALRAAGFTVMEAVTGSEAQTVLRSSVTVDLLLTELQFDGPIDGVTLMQLARSARPHLKIVVASSQIPGWPLRRTVDAFFGKPYDIGRVVKRIKGLVRGEAG